MNEDLDFYNHMDRQDDKYVDELRKEAKGWQTNRPSREDCKEEDKGKEN